MAKVLLYLLGALGLICAEMMALITGMLIIIALDLKVSRAN